MMGVLLLIAATSLTHRRVLERRAHFSAEEDALYLPRPSALKVMSLGHHELVADLVFVRAIIYFGGQFHGKRDYRWLDNYLETILALDRRWKTPYRWAGVATMYDGRAITNESVARSTHFLEMRVEQFPSDWELPFMLGCNYLFELQSDDAAQRAKWQEQGADWVRHAALVGGAPSWVPLLAATIMRREGRDEAAIRHLEEVYRSTQDEKTREDVRNQLMALHAKVDFAKEDRERHRFENAWRRTLPYASPDFFVAAGERPSPRMDLEALAANPAFHASVVPDHEFVE